jgi:hypothetical protein
VGADDNHYKKENVGSGWIMVRSPALTKTDIIDNIRSGNFYASTGVILTGYKVTGNSIDISSMNGDSIIFSGRYGEILKSVSGKSGKYKIRGNEYYVRAKIINSEGKAAWTQPVSIH